MKELLEEFIEWYRWDSTHDAFELFDESDKIIDEFIKWKNK